MLDVRRLRILHAVSAYGSVTAAAAALGYSAPAVSSSWPHWSGRWHSTHRAGRPGHRTNPGRRDLGRAHRRPAGPAGRGRGRPGRAARSGRRPGRAGRVPVGRATFVAAAWAALARAAPRVQLDLTEMEPEESLPALLRGETDVAVAHEYDLLPRPLDPLFERRELRADPVLLAVPTGHPLATASTLVPLEALAGPAVPRAAGQHQLRRDDPAGLRPGRFRAPRSSPAPPISPSCSAWSRPAPASPWSPPWPPPAPAGSACWPPPTP